jgi:hypothetical protein
MTYLLEDVEDSRVGVLQGRCQELEIMLARRLQGNSDPLSRRDVFPTFCCASRLAEDTPRTEIVRGTKARVDTDTGVRRAPRETRARRPQRERDMVNKLETEKNHNIQTSRSDRKAFLIKKTRLARAMGHSGGGQLSASPLPAESGKKPLFLIGIRRGSPPGLCVDGWCFSFRRTFPVFFSSSHN